MYAQSGIQRGGQALDAQFSGSDDFWGPRLHVQRGVHLLPQPSPLHKAPQGSQWGSGAASCRYDQAG
jgi:hypothetical protein